MSESGSESHDFDDALWAAFRQSATPARIAAELFGVDSPDPEAAGALHEALPAQTPEMQPSTPPSYKQKEKKRKQILRKAKDDADYAAMQKEVDKQHAEQGFILQDEVKAELSKLSKKTVSLALVAEQRQRAAQEARNELLMHMENAKEGKKQITLMSFFKSALPCLPQLPTPKDYCSIKGLKTYSMCVYVYVIMHAHTFAICF